MNNHPHQPLYGIMGPQPGQQGQFGVAQGTNLDHFSHQGLIGIAQGTNNAPGFFTNQWTNNMLPTETTHQLGFHPGQQLPPQLNLPQQPAIAPEQQAVPFGAPQTQQNQQQNVPGNFGHVEGGPTAIAIVHGNPPTGATATTVFTEEEKRKMFFDQKDATDHDLLRRKAEKLDLRCSAQNLPIGNYLWITPTLLMSKAQVRSMFKIIAAMVRLQESEWPIDDGLQRTLTTIQSAHYTKFYSFLRKVVAMFPALQNCHSDWKGLAVLGRVMRAVFDKENDQKKKPRPKKRKSDEAEQESSKRPAHSATTSTTAASTAPTATAATAPTAAAVAALIDTTANIPTAAANATTAAANAPTTAAANIPTAAANAPTAAANAPTTAAANITTAAANAHTAAANAPTTAAANTPTTAAANAPTTAAATTSTTAASTAPTAAAANAPIAAAVAAVIDTTANAPTAAANTLIDTAATAPTDTAANALIDTAATALIDMAATAPDAAVTAPIDAAMSIEPDATDTDNAAATALTDAISTDTSTNSGLATAANTTDTAATLTSTSAHTNPVHSSAARMEESSISDGPFPFMSVAVPAPTMVRNELNSNLLNSGGLT
ncbi:hypothetical protein OC844_007512 [Tilletia horrida]|nr:hypothetical protein OC844_007512 [Tilletia horrida]